MLNCEKTILVAYINIYNIKKEERFLIIDEFKNDLRSSFHNEEKINDDSLVILVIPADRTEIQLLNARYPDYKELENFAQHKMIEFIENHEKNI